MLEQSAPQSMIAEKQVSSFESVGAGVPDNDLVLELERKRHQLDQEIVHFRAQKDKEFRQFEKELRGNRKRMEGNSSSLRRAEPNRNGTCSKNSTRQLSSSALDLLVGHGVSRPSGRSSIPSNQTGSRCSDQKDVSLAKAGPLPCKPTLSLEPLNIKGETIQKPQSHEAPKATAKSSPPARSSSAVPSPVARSKKAVVVCPPKPYLPPTPTKDSSDAFAGLFTPAYLPLLDAKNAPQFPSPSPLVTPPAEDEEQQHSHNHNPAVYLPSGIIPLQSSSFPPVVAALAPSNSIAKRAYTTPTSNPPRKPSALRSSSGSNLARKRKHVTFRLADSAIVEPSSSYEEGPSPLDDQSRQSKSAPPGSPANRGSRSPLRYTTPGSRNGLLGDHSRSDEEDAAAGVRPGMNMGEVMQKLNEFSQANSGDQVDEITLEDEEDEDVGWTDTKYHEDEDEEEEDDDGDDDDDDDLYIDREPDEAEAESYFSPRSQHTCSIPVSPAYENESRKRRDRSGSSPLEPYRDQHWNGLSPTDKDRLLFSQRVSDGEDSDHSGHGRPPPRQGSFSGGLKKNNSHGSLTSLANLAGHSNQRTASASTKIGPSNTAHRFKPSIDGGSGIGFFELDEELASPDAGKADPFTFDHDEDEEGLGSSTTDLSSKNARSPSTNVEDEAGSMTFANIATITSGFGVGSMPINIVRPSVSVSSSWRGTFGH